jgi:WD40 repeat protein
VLDGETGAQLEVLRPAVARGHEVWDLELDHRGEQVALAEPDGIIVLDVSTGHQELVVPWPRGSWGPNDLAWSPDDQRLAVAIVNGNPRRTLAVVDLGGEGPTWVPEQPGWTTRSISFSPDGRLLATSHWGTRTVDPTRMPVRTWDLESGELTPDLDAQARLVAYAPAGHLLATSRAVEGVAETWDARTQERVAVLTATASVEDLDFDPTGTTLATAHGDGTVRLWDAREGTQDLVLRVSDQVVERVRFSQDGSRLVTMDRDGVSRVWALDLDDLIALARERLTRDLTAAECREYLRLASCPAS